MSEIKLNMPFDKEELKKLRAGDNVLLSGEMFVFRDAGHKRLFASIEAGRPDIDFSGQTVYFMGPCPAQIGQVMGSSGKGKRSKECIDAFIRNGGVYFAAIGGAGALYSKCVKKVEEICYPDLGTEAIRRITVEDFPVVVAIDSLGGSVYGE